MNASDLNMELVSDGLEVCHFCSQFRKLDVNGCSQSCSKVGWA